MYSLVFTVVDVQLRGYSTGCGLLITVLNVQLGVYSAGCTAWCLHFWMYCLDGEELYVKNTALGLNQDRAAGTFTPDSGTQLREAQDQFAD